MSDDGERTCPLCAEEMDLTDQQLKPCKCGYEICVWCWHHIMDMAEKDDTEGRCPACRTPYDKERIVGMAASCERMVAEINAEKKHKSQKAKLKTSAEARKHLSSVRVIQRNLVYIIGLPSNLCDESILERKEYFGQYGKVLKVSISRPAGGTNQQAPNNNTFSVYITYAREEEAVRCIQAVHNFVLEGKSLRACFGTTKYCHAWLRNMTCSNPDCLYLHDIGSQEDSFTKDEIISAYTRSRVPQIASNTSQRRSGSVLPPPADDFASSVAVSCKHVVKPSNNASAQVKGSPPNSNAGKSTVLPAAASWGLRSSNCRPLSASMLCSQAPVKQKAETHYNSTSLSPMVATIKQSSAWHDDIVTTSKSPEGRQVVHMSGKSRPLEPSKPVVGKDCQTALSSGALLDSDCTSRPSAWNDDVVTTPEVCEERRMVDVDDRSRPSEPLRPVVDGDCRASVSVFSPEDVSNVAHTSQMSTSCLPSILASPAGDRGRSIALIESHADQVNSHSFNCDDRRSTSADEVTEGRATVNGNVESLCIGLTSVNIDSHLGVDQLDMGQHQTSGSDSQVLNELSDWRSERQKQGLMSTRNEIEDDSAANDNLRFRLSDVTDSSSSSYINQSRSRADYSGSWNFDTGNKYHTITGGYETLDTKLDTALPPSRENEVVLCNGHKDDMSSFSKTGKVFEYPVMNCTEENAKCIGRFDDVANFDKTANVDMGESSIISDILSLDFDPWDDSLSSANNISKLLGETKKQDGSFNLSSSWKSPNCSQSRFSFARQESQPSFVEPCAGDGGHVHKLCLPTQNSSGDGFQNRFLANNFEVPNATTSTNTVISSERLAGVSRAKISAPPGFSTPSRAPPPGFSSQDRFNQAYETTYTDNHLLGGPLLGNHNQAHLTGSSADVEFIDPAILAVGKGRIPLGVSISGPSLKPTFPTQFSSSDGDPRLQLLMQQSISSHQNIRIPDHVGDRFFPVNDSFIASQLLAQNHGRLSPFAEMSRQQSVNSYMSSNQWDNWNDVDMGMNEILRNERFALNNYYGSNEEHKFHMPNSGDVYSRAFGM